MCDKEIVLIIGGGNTNMKFDGIIFDLDGTLWDSTKIELKAINDVINNEYNINTITIEQLKNVMGYPMPEAAKIIFKNVDNNIGIQILKKSGIMMDQYLKECKSNLLYDNLKETISNLSKNYKLFIVSNCKEGYIETFMHSQNLTEIFQDYESNGRTKLSKGENIKLIIERNKLKNAIYVGDTIKDKQAADYANIPFIYASYGFGKVEQYDYKINKFKEIINIVNN